MCGRLPPPACAVATTDAGGRPHDRDYCRRSSSRGRGADRRAGRGARRGRDPAFVGEQLAAVDLDGRSVCVLVPDGTRSCPLPLLLSAVHGALHGRVTQLTVLVALGTHAGMSEAALAEHLGYPAGGLADRYPGTTVLNHEWWDPATFATSAPSRADRIAELSNGMLRQQRGRARSTGPWSSTTSR